MKLIYSLHHLIFEFFFLTLITDWWTVVCDLLNIIVLQLFGKIAHFYEDVLDPLVVVFIVIDLFKKRSSKLCKCCTLDTNDTNILLIDLAKYSVIFKAFYSVLLLRWFVFSKKKRRLKFIPHCLWNEICNDFS